MAWTPYARRLALDAKQRYAKAPTLRAATGAKAVPRDNGQQLPLKLTDDPPKGKK